MRVPHVNGQSFGQRMLAKEPGNKWREGIVIRTRVPAAALARRLVAVRVDRNEGRSVDAYGDAYGGRSGKCEQAVP